ncbi:MAG TPA: hypothetical protein VFQ22_11205, partial [Longimicrobiales bacterium]|nr:hypothetical protein [Longimicrobiales bacterium]
VSISPSVSFIEDDRVGAVKLYWQKGRELPAVEAAHAATLLRVFLDEHLVGSPHSVDPRLCQIIDVWRGVIFTAPEAYKQRLTRIAASCREIARQWPIERWDFPYSSPAV